MRCPTIEIYDRGIDDLVRHGLLDADQRNDTGVAVCAICSWPTILRLIFTNRSSRSCQGSRARSFGVRPAETDIPVSGSLAVLVALTGRFKLVIARDVRWEQQFGQDP